MPFTSKSIFAVIAAFGVWLGQPGLAQDASPAAASFSLELNRATATDAGECRLVFVARNGSEAGLATASYQFAVFNPEGIHDSMVTLPFTDIAGGKTRVFQFDLPVACGSIGELLINSVVQCAETGGGTSVLCSEGLEVSSRADGIELVD